MGGMETRGGTQSFGGNGSGGALGSGGNATVPECETDDDCEIAKDCCNCHAVPRDASFGVCRLDCGGSDNLCECLSPCGGYGCAELDEHIGCFCAGC